MVRLRFSSRSRYLFSLVCALLLAFCVSWPVWAQVQVIEWNVDNRFGEAINFHVRMRSDAPVQSAEIVIHKQGESEPLIAPVEIGADGELRYLLDLKAMGPGQTPPRAFSKLRYRFQGKLENEEEFTSQEFSFDYVDNRFSWKEKESGLIRVHWYQGEDGFAQAILDVANQGLQKAQELLPLQVESEIDIYVYASASEMQAALSAAQNWVAGQAAPDLNVSVVSLPAERPETRLEIKRQIPHELMHILLYQYQEKGYANLPIWLVEGLASLAELTPNPDYQAIMVHAIQKDALIPMVSLCSSFPLDISGALLAYAEANSFIRYLYGQYGSSGLDKLVRGYADGLDCQRGVEVAFGNSLEKLEEQWLEETYGVNALQKALRTLLPWFALFFVVVALPLGFTLGGLARWKKGGVLPDGGSADQALVQVSPKNG